LSGGEAQRIKLALELSKRATGSTFYILDEPTTGLHFADLENLISIFKKLVARGNTVVVIEHNLDIVRNSDWVIDLGPEGGAAGGELIYSGPTKEVYRRSFEDV
jgi:excinuclease ABC subunit A